LVSKAARIIAETGANGWTLTPAQERLVDLACELLAAELAEAEGVELALDSPTRGRGVEEVALVPGLGIHVEVALDQRTWPVDPPFFDNLRRADDVR